MSEQSLAVEPKTSSRKKSTGARKQPTKKKQQTIQPQAFLSPDLLIVRLYKTFSWERSSSRWPFYLSRAELGREYTKKEIIETIFQDDRADQKASNISWLRSIYGLYIDYEHQEVTLEGIGLFERTDAVGEVFHITDDGLQLAQAYSADPGNDGWKRVFANILARNDVRVRCVLLHLARWQLLLTFQDGLSAHAFFLDNKGGTLKDSDGMEYALFEEYQNHMPANSFSILLQREPYTTLGPFLRSRIEKKEFNVPNHIVFEGGRALITTFREPSAIGLRTHLKQALSLFRDIGALVYVPHKQGWMLDRKRCEEVLDPEVVADLFGEAPESRFLEVLQAAAAKFSNAEGLVRVADIRDYVCDELDIPPGERIDYFNKQVAYYMRPDGGRLAIGRTFHAAAPPNDCLFGDLEQEYVEFLFASA